MSNGRWKALERTAAHKLGGQRVHRQWELFEVAPDVLVPDFKLVIDAKAYKRFSHHTLIEAVQRKYCRPDEVPVLVTKAEGQTGEFATLPLDALANLLDEVRRARA